MSYMFPIERTPVQTFFFIPPSFTALETAMLLFTSCPARAKGLALSMYERAAWGHRDTARAVGGDASGGMMRCCG
jgi:hypothetical protein